MRYLGLYDFLILIPVSMALAFVIFMGIIAVWDCYFNKDNNEHI